MVKGTVLRRGSSGLGSKYLLRGLLENGPTLRLPRGRGGGGGAPAGDGPARGGVVELVRARRRVSLTVPCYLSVRTVSGMK